jgi:hypothetical protein
VENGTLAKGAFTVGDTTKEPGILFRYVSLNITGAKVNQLLPDYNPEKYGLWS